MRKIDLKYGSGSFTFGYDPDKFEVLSKTDHTPALSDAAIGAKLDDPIDSASLDEIAPPGNSVLIVVPDATRQTGCGQILNLLIRRLIANGTAAHDIRIIFATGIHRQVTEAERAMILTPFIAQRIKCLDHDPRDLMQLVRVGETSGGIPVELNRALFEHDSVILIGGVSFHYFAGFTGGRKLVCPGLASSRTVTQTHKLAFDCDRRTRRDGVGTGLLDGNAVHEAFVEAASFVRTTFCITTAVNGSGEVVDLFCGHRITAHRAACDAYQEQNTISVVEKRPLVIVSCGGYPYDINLVQAHKAFEAATHACSEGGTVILAAECRDGLGHPEMAKWFAAKDSRELAALLCERYQVNGQTAWSLLEKAERFDLKVVTFMSETQAALIRSTKIEPTAIEPLAAKYPAGYIMPSGAKIAVTSGEPIP